MKDQKWFEMEDLKKLDFNTRSWTPLAAFVENSDGKYGYVGYDEDYISCFSILISVSAKEYIKDLEWMDISDGVNSPYADDKNYYPARDFSACKGKIKGEYLVLRQIFDTGDESEWYLSEDLIIALGLKRDGNIWYRPEEDNVEVVRLKKKKDGEPELIEIRTEFLKDYLCSRNSGLLVYNYYARTATEEKIKFNGWGKEIHEKKDENWYFQGRIDDIVEGGELFGQKVKTLHVQRIDVDYDEDMPVKEGFPDENGTITKMTEYEYKGKKLQSIRGELWKKFWITPGNLSPRIRSDKKESTVEFLIDVNGTKKTLNNMGMESRWIWFKPDVVNEILKRKNSRLFWYSENTGVVGTSELHKVHFGMNELGIINVFAKDIGNLPEHQQRIWAAFNITPDGKVSKELLDSQMKSTPAKTLAPETKFMEGLKFSDQQFTITFNKNLFKEHVITEEIMEKIQRFVVVDLESLYKLCKDINRIVVERINISGLKEIISENSNKLGSIKLLEKILNNLGLKGRELTTPFVGVNELRQADTHLPSSNYEDSYKLLGIDFQKPFPLIGKHIIDLVAKHLLIIASILYEKNHPNKL
jgi:hypothetical protein